MLEYVALGILIFAAVTIFYGIIVIHDIPYEIAKKRNHPQQDALHVAGWVSLFTLHVLWPFSNTNNANSNKVLETVDLIKRIEILEQQMAARVENRASSNEGDK